MVMDKSNLPPPPPAPSSSTSTAFSSLKSLNKSSYKIAKQSSTASSAASASSMGATYPPPPPQPPVYNIDKSDFRHVVQKLTGSPSHLLPPQAPAPAAAAGTMAPRAAIPSRLHRIRPPPLAAPRPMPVLAPAPPALSPLPPLPAVCMSAESPISAYMRRFRGMPSPIHVPSSPLGFGCLPSPRTPPSPGVPMPAASPRVRDP